MEHDRWSLKLYYGYQRRSRLGIAFRRKLTLPLDQEQGLMSSHMQRWEYEALHMTDTLPPLLAICKP